MRTESHSAPFARLILLSTVIVLLYSPHDLFAAAATQQAPGPAAGYKKLALLVGINRYKYVSGLKGAVNDVKNMKRLLVERFGFPDDVEHIRVLTDSQATREAILRAIRDHLILKSTPDSIVVFHYSSHGSQVVDPHGDEIDSYDETIVPYDSGRQADGHPNQDITDDELMISILSSAALAPGITSLARSTELSDPAIRGQAAISSEEMVERLKQSPALKQVMVLDTCAAGTAAKLVEKRDISSDQIRAIERLKDRTGFHVMMGSAADAVSYEATRYEQGLLTYALLEGMRGAALREQEYVDVSKLFQYAADAVPDLAQNIGGIQRPRIAAPRGTSFDIGQLKQEDRQKIPLAQSKPILLPPLLQNGEELFDNLDLTARVRKQMREVSYASSRGAAGQFPAVYLEADQLEGAIRPSGTYLVREQAVTVNLVLVRDGNKLASFQVQGAAADLEGLASKIIDRISAAMRDIK